MWRKRATPAPGFRQAQPFNPIAGDYARIGTKGVVTRIAMMQVIEADTHDNYVVCRGFDPERGKFLNEVNVAKPYGLRGSNGVYVVGQVFSAAKPLTRLGETPGKGETTTGHPADLNEAIEILTDDAGNPVAWLDIGGGGGGPRFAWATTTGEWNSSTLSWNVTTVEPFDGSTFDGDDPLSVANPQGLVAESGQVGIIAYTTDPTSGEGAWEVVYFKGLEQVVMTDFQVDAATFKLQKKTRTFFAQVDDAESGWTDIHTGTDCS